MLIAAYCVPIVDCRQFFGARRPCDRKRDAGVPHLLAHLQHRGLSVVQREILQMCQERHIGEA